MDNDREGSTKTIGVMMLLTLLGKLLGLYRDRLLAVHYGTGLEANAFYTASRIPRVFFDAVFASAITACFIPVFSEYLTQKGRDAANRFGSCFLTLMALVTAVLSVLGMALAGPLVTLFADGYDAATAALAVSLTRMLFPTVLFTGVAFSFVGILQSLGEFRVPALISAASNLVVIGYYLLLDRSFGIYGLAAAFLAGWLAQALIQLPALRRKGFRYRPRLAIRDEGMGKVFSLMLPVMVATWVQPINLTINSKFGSRLYGGAGVSAIEYATNLYLVVAGVFILSVTNVIFPKLSRLSAGAEEDAFRETLSGTLGGCLYLVLPMGAGLMLLARPLVSFLYGGGAFDAFSVEITSRALFWVSTGIAGYAVQNVLSRACFARQQGRLPLLAGAASIAVNIVLCLLLTERWQVEGLAIASAASSTVYALLLDLPLERRGEGIGRLWRSVLKMLLATGCMALAAWGVRELSGGLLPGKAGELLAMAATALTGVAVYFPVSLLLGLDEARAALDTVKRLLKRG